MARIRSVHPGFWTDEVTMSLTMECPLGIPLLIGLWNEADDQGLFEWKPLTLKARILPAAACNVSELLDDLAGRDAIMRYEINGKPYGAIRNFRVWQKPKTPNAIHPITAEIRNYVGLTAPDSETTADDGEQLPNHFGNASEKVSLMEDGGGKMEDGGGVEKGKGASAPARLPAEQPSIDLAQVAEAYNTVARECGWAECQKFDRSRQAAAKARLAEAGGIEGWRHAMGKARASPFLRGETGRSAGHENWRPDIDFFLKPKTFTKLMEGGYDGQQGHRTGTPQGRGKPALSAGWMAGALSAIETLEGG